MAKIVDEFGNIEFEVKDNAGVVKGNRALSNRFAITLLTNTQASYLTYGYGGNINNGIRNANADASASAAAITGACDQTVAAMKSDQAGLPDTEQISSAAVESIEKSGDKVMVSIRIIPVKLDEGALQGPLVSLPL